MDITLNGEKFKLVKYSCSPKIVETGEGTTTLDGVTHVEGRKIKRSIAATTCDLLPHDAMRLLEVLRNTYVMVTYQDTLLGKEDTRVFVVDAIPDIEVKMWRNGKQYYAGAKLTLVEKGAE